MKSELITTFKEYQEVYNTRLENHLKKYIDYDEIHFIKSELIYFSKCHASSNIIYQEKIRYLPDDCHETYYEYDVCNYDLFVPLAEVMEHLKIDWEDCWDLELCEKLFLSFTKIIDFLEEKERIITIQPIQPIQPIQNKVKFYGNKTEFVELIKSLIENGNFKGTQKDVTENCAKFFDIEVHNFDITVQKLKGRNNGSETLFLDKLKSTLFNYITLDK